VIIYSKNDNCHSLCILWLYLKNDRGSRQQKNRNHTDNQSNVILKEGEFLWKWTLLFINVQTTTLHAGIKFRFQNDSEKYQTPGGREKLRHLRYSIWEYFQVAEEGWDGGENNDADADLNLLPIYIQ
jgi:hypothetical protein